MRGVGQPDVQQHLRVQVPFRAICRLITTGRGGVSKSWAAAGQHLKTRWPSPGQDHGQTAQGKPETAAGAAPCRADKGPCSTYRPQAPASPPPFSTFVAVDYPCLQGSAGRGGDRHINAYYHAVITCASRSRLTHAVEPQLELPRRQAARPEIVTEVACLEAAIVVVWRVDLKAVVSVGRSVKGQVIGYDGSGAARRGHLKVLDSRHGVLHEGAVLWRILGGRSNHPVGEAGRVEGVRVGGAGGNACGAPDDVQEGLGVGVRVGEEGGGGGGGVGEGDGEARQGQQGEGLRAGTGRMCIRGSGVGG